LILRKRIIAMLFVAMILLLRGAGRSPMQELKLETVDTMEEILPLLTELLSLGKSVRIYPRGTSMLPMLRQGIDSVVLSPVTDAPKKYDIPLFDFNLLKSRYELFSDETSFSDDNHLSEEGAEIFSGVMADVLHRHRAGEDVSPLFYESYRDVIRNSVYRSM